MDTVYDRLSRMAVTRARVVDPRTVAGEVCVDVDSDRWLQDPTAGSLGYFGLYVAKIPPTEFRDNVLVALTRFIVDSNVEVNSLFDYIEQEARALPEWLEQRAERDQPNLRAEGASFQSGCYRDPNAGWLFTATQYIAYQRANVVYLLQCTATSASQDRDVWRELTDTVRSARLED